MANDQTLQVVLPAPEAAAFREMATQLGLSVSAYLRNLISARGQPLVAAWSYIGFHHEQPKQRREMRKSELLNRMTRRTPSFFLEMIAEGTGDGGAEYLVYIDGWVPLVEKDFREYDEFKRAEEFHLMLSGSAQLWRIARSISNLRARSQVRWLLAPATGEE